MKSFADYDGEFGDCSGTGAIPKILAMSVTERAFVNFFLLSNAFLAISNLFSWMPRMCSSIVSLQKNLKIKKN